MSGIASMLGIGSSQAELSEDEASDVSEVATPAPTVKQEKKVKEPAKPKEKAKPKMVQKQPEKEKEEEEESLMVESDKDEDEDEDDDEVGPDECVSCHLRAVAC